jgi:type III pantothenate kinase
LSHGDIAFKDINDVIFSSVVPQANFEFEKFCSKYLEIEPINISQIREQLPINIDMDKPEEVGADRLVNSIAAYEKQKPNNKNPIIIVDFGTATTFDVVDINSKSKPTYMGGAISPGIELSLAALHQKAASLPKISAAKPEKAIGKNTKQAMQAGIYNGYMGLIEKNIEEISCQLGKNTLNIATGGLASLFKDCKKIDHIEENLTLEGLEIIYRNLETGK